MHPHKLHRLLFAALLAAIVTLPALAAGKHRSVRHTSPANRITGEISGIVLDSVTGLPVVAARVQAAEGGDNTDKDGKFFIRNAAGYGSINLTVTRTGYNTNTLSLATGGKHDVTIRVVPKPTVRVRLAAGTTYDLDADSILFGYPVAFSGYRSAEFEEFCKANGSLVTVDRSEIARINGPATMVRYSTCCANADTLKVNVTLKSGEVTDMYFVDACNGFANIDLIGREHVSAKFQYIPFNTIAEVVFP